MALDSLQPSVEEILQLQAQNVPYMQYSASVLGHLSKALEAQKNKK